MNEINFDPDAFIEGTNMTNARYDDLMHGPSPQNLTEEEMKQGWHFCHNGWDGLLIHDSWKTEIEHCHCSRQENE